VLPVDSEENIISLGEGWTPLLPARRLGAKLGLKELYIKDESQNPTQSFQSTRHGGGGIDGERAGSAETCGASAGNAAGALAAYAARAGMAAFIFMPKIRRVRM